MNLSGMDMDNMVVDECKWSKLGRKWHLKPNDSVDASDSSIKQDCKMFEYYVEWWSSKTKSIDNDYQL